MRIEGAVRFGQERLVSGPMVASCLNSGFYGPLMMRRSCVAAQFLAKIFALFEMRAIFWLSTPLFCDHFGSVAAA